MTIVLRVPALATLVLLTTANAEASVTLSVGKTENMSCSSGVCAPTAADAVLNVADLEVLLAAGPTTVTTTGSSVQADNIVIRDALTWTSANALALDAYHSIAIDDSVSIGGTAGLDLESNGGGSGGEMEFGHQGHVVFSNLSSALTINGAPYTLVGDIRILATDIAANPAGNFALAANYDASKDGAYKRPPISTNFGGQFEGLGNYISNLSIHDPKNEDIGLFSKLYGGQISNISVVDADVVSTNTDSTYTITGILLGFNSGTVSRSYSNGKLDSATGSVGGLIGKIGAVGRLDHSSSAASISVMDNATVAGLVGFNYGKITNSSATGAISSIGFGGSIAGLVGANEGSISTSFSSGNISNFSGADLCGGLVGVNNGTVGDAYATGKVTCKKANGNAGGFAYSNTSIIQNSYSTGKVSGYYAAGFLIDETENGQMKGNYWDTTTSRTNLGVYSGSSTGLTGLTTQQLQGGLPKGFSPKIWAENPKINNGFPYLIANPPPNK